MSAVEQFFEQLNDASDAYSGVIQFNDGAGNQFEFAGGFADRAEARPITMSTRLATASGTKGFTALTIMSQIEDGLFALETPVLDIVGSDLVGVDAAVTIEQLLGHTSGAGDYLDEDEIESADDYLLDVPMHTLLGPTNYLPLLNRHSQVEAPGSQFRYNNGGFIMLALVVERAGKYSYHDEVRRRIFEAANMISTDFYRSDQLPADTALGYLTDGRTNVHHLPVLGTGDGGAYTTAGDMMRFWDALFAGRIVLRESVRQMIAENDRAKVDIAEGKDSYGLGFWIGTDRTTVLLEGLDAGVSLRSGMNPATGASFCLIANNSTDVWPLGAIVDGYMQTGTTA